MSSTTTKTNTTPVVIGLLIGILVAAMDNTIVATAMPTIVSELNGFDQYAWVTSAYMIATVAGMPIFGKLSDMYGRKRFFLFGMLLFMVGVSYVEWQTRSLNCLPIVPCKGLVVGR